MIGALLSLLRRVPVRRQPTACWSAANWARATVGLIGMPPAARSMAQMLGGFGSQVVGYDPSLHASDGVWERWRVEPLGLRELLEQSRRGVRAAQLLQPLPGPARRPLPAVLQAQPGDRQPGAFGAVRRGRAGRCAGQRPHRRGLARQPGARRARPRPAAGRHRARCRSRRAWPAPRANRACAAPGRWRGASTSCSPTRAAAAPSSGRRTQASRLISQPGQRRREVGDALRSCSTTAAGARATKLSLASLASALAISPSRRAISLARRSRLGGHVDLHVQRQARVALHRHRRAARGLRRTRLRRRTPAPRTSLASAFSTGAAWRMKAASPQRQQRHALRPATGSSRCAACGRRRPGP